MIESRDELTNSWLDRARRYAPAVAVYLLATALTGAAFMGDTDDYVDSAVAYAEGVNYRFWEFGHLFWRPLGWLLSRVLQPATQAFVGADLRLNVTLTFLILNWLAGLLAVVALCALLRCFCRREWVVNVLTFAFIFSNGFLNYAQTGCSYVPGLAFLTLGLYFLARGDGRTRPGDERTTLDERTTGDGERATRGGERFDASTWRTALLAGASLALSVCLWFLYVWALPGVLLAPLLLYGFGRRQLRLVVQTTLVCGLLGGLAYALVVWHLRIGSVAELRAWIAPQGAPDIKGVSRMLFGFARSLVNMGSDGTILKRYMIRDAFNPVSLSEIIRLSLWKFVLFYLFLAATLVNLLRSNRGRRVLALFVASAAPVIGFAIVFLGGDLERYFPLYPVLFAAAACALCDERALAPLKWVALVFVAVLLVSNARAMSNAALESQQAKIAGRVEALRPLLKPQSKVYAVNWQDELVNFKRSFPFHPVNRDHNLRLNSVVTPNSPWLPRWRTDFAAEALSIWRAGGDVWISRRALSPRPRPDWNWVEGDDRRISWTDINDFFSHLELGQSVGGDDGFALVLPSAGNEQILRSYAAQENNLEVKQP